MRGPITNTMGVRRVGEFCRKFGDYRHSQLTRGSMHGMRR